MKTLNQFLLFLFIIGCNEISQDSINVDEKGMPDDHLNYPSLDHFITDLSNSQISLRTTNERRFFSYQDMMDSLRNYVAEEKLCTHEEALAFINNNKLYYQLEYDEDGELNASERLRSSKLSHYLNSKGEIVIGDVSYRLSEYDLILKAQSNGNAKSRSHLPDIAINDCLISSLEEDCNPLSLTEEGNGGSSTLNCGLYKDYPNYLGCSKGRGFTTYTDGDERIKYESYHVSSSCRVQFQVHAVSQNRFLRIWWDESRPLKGYAAEKVNYLLWDGTPGETLAESGIVERTTSHLYIPVWVVPQSVCTTSNGTYRCYGAEDSHYEVDAYWFWIVDSTGAGTRIEECDKPQVCIGTMCPDPFTGIPTNICDPNDCPPDHLCMNGSCIPITFPGCNNCPSSTHYCQDGNCIPFEIFPF